MDDEFYINFVNFAPIPDYRRNSIVSNSNEYMLSLIHISEPTRP